MQPQRLVSLYKMPEKCPAIVSSIVTLVADCDVCYPFTKAKYFLTFKIPS